MTFQQVDGVPTQMIGRYAIFAPLASGGMATVHLARLLGASGFARTVAIKRMHPSLVSDPEFVRSFLDEARLCSGIRHPNVVGTIDIVSTRGELFLVMEYVHGEPLSRLWAASARGASPLGLPVATSVLCGMLEGLHAAHQARDDHGRPLCVVHRDVSPQNVLVGTDGLPRVVDFGVAKAMSDNPHTAAGVLKGKLTYMAPEQVHNRAVSPRTDVYSAGVVAWELFTGQRFRNGKGGALELLRQITRVAPSMRSVRPELPEQLDAVVMKALQIDESQRYASAREFGIALSRAVPPASSWEVAEWLGRSFADSLSAREALLREVEQLSRLLPPPTSSPPPRPLPPAVGDGPELEVSEGPSVEVWEHAVEAEGLAPLARPEPPGDRHAVTAVRHRPNPRSALAALLFAGAAVLLLSWLSLVIVRRAALHPLGREPGAAP